MAGKSLGDSTLNEIERLLNDEEFSQFSPTRIDVLDGNDNEITPSTTTISDPLNMAFLNESHINEEQQVQINLSQQQSQTTKETSLTIDSLIDEILKEKDDIIDLCTPTKTTMKSIGTMPKTPSMKSIRSMPKTPIMVLTDTIPKPQIMISTDEMSATPTMKSTGTMTRTTNTKSMGTMSSIPIMKSTGTMASTPTMKSAGTMPKTPTKPDTSD